MPFRFDVKETMKNMKIVLLYVAFAIVVLSLLGGCVALKYRIYRERFPDAAPWTFLFR